MNVFRMLTTRLRREQKRPFRVTSYRFKPLIEVLEDRISPAVVQWSGAGTNNEWSNRFNWQGNAVPGMNDTAWIPNGNCALGENVTVSGLTLGASFIPGTA